MATPDLSILGKEIKHTLRALWRERTFAVSVTLLLAVGIGFPSAVFTLLWQALYAQLPVPHPEGIFTLKTNVTHQGRSDTDSYAQTFSLPTYRFLLEHDTSGGGPVARHGELVNIEIASGSQHALVDFVTPNFFDVLGVRALAGRTFQTRQSGSGEAVYEAVLSYDYWQQAFGGELRAWNSELRVNGVAFRVIGIAVPGFHGLISGQAPRLYLPVSSFEEVNPGWHGSADWSVRWLNLFVRVPEIGRVSQTLASLQSVYRAAVRMEVAAQAIQSPDYLKELDHERLSLLPASQGVHASLDQWKTPLQVLQWMTLAVLFLVILNLSGLMMIRALKRQRETGIRRALGATAAALIRLSLYEAVLLSVFGGALGYWIAQAGAQLLVHWARLDRDGVLQYSPSGWLLVAHWSGALATGVAVGLLSGWQAAGLGESSQVLSDSAPTHSGARAHVFARKAIAAAQIALSTVLAISATSLAVAFHQLTTVPLGFDPTHLTTFTVDAKLRSLSTEGVQTLWSDLGRRLKETPGVTAASYGTGGPFPQDADSAVVIPGKSPGQSRKHVSGTRSMVGPAYFKALGIPMIAGREFDERDRPSGPGTVILNQTMATRLFGAEPAVGQVVTLFNGLQPNWLATVVGIAADHRQSWRRSGTPLVYTPVQQATLIPAMTYYVRTQDRYLPETAIRRIVHKTFPSVVPYDIATMPTRMEAFASSERTLTLLIVVFAGLAFAITATGVYGIVAYGVSLRKVELAVRLALGASPVRIFSTVVVEAVLVLLAGLMLALPLSHWGLALLGHQIMGISSGLRWIYLGNFALVLFVTLIAAGLPARQVLRTDVPTALRHA